MKKIYILTALCFSILTFGQLSLEHIYPENGIKRVNLEFSGEKYYLADNSTHEILIYNADHTLWKSIPYNAPPLSAITIWHLSESQINADANVEAAYTVSYYNGPTLQYEGNIISENTDILLATNDIREFVVDIKTGLLNKLIAIKTDGTSIVYDLPGCNVEHIYYEGRVARVSLENEGEKYYVMDVIAGQLKILHPDHTLWKVIALPKPTVSTYKYVLFASEHQVNIDDLIEVSYTYCNQTVSPAIWESKLVNENGEVLLNVPNASGLYFERINGVEDKLVTKQVNNDGPVSNSYYSLPGLALEHSYPRLMRRSIFGYAGEKYYNLYSENGLCVVYNSDHTVWKSIDLGIPNEFQNQRIDHVSDSKLNDDALVEVSFGYTQPISGGFYYESKVINEFGNVLLTVPDCLNLSLIELPGYDDKLIGLMYTDGGYFFASVYGLNGPLSVNQIPVDKQNEPILYPNPATDSINIISNREIVSAKIFNQMGKVVKQINSNMITAIQTADLPFGYYFVTITNSDNRQSTHKIIISQ